MTSCKNETVYIKGIDYASTFDETLQKDGELKVTVELSSYNDTQTLGKSSLHVFMNFAILDLFTYH